MSEPAHRARSALRAFDGVASRADLVGVGIDADQIAAQLSARRWQAHGAAIVLHNTGLTSAQRRRTALINCGPRAVLTSFTAMQVWGLRGWERREVHVLAPAGTPRPDQPALVLHRTGDWSRIDHVRSRRLHRLAPAAVLAASSFASPRPACGILAACVQQRLVRPEDLRRAVEAAPRTRHRALLLAAVADISQGARALSEIDFVRLCRRNGLPSPTLQAIRIEAGGQRRYLDAEWQLADGRLVAAEVDGALHLTARRWVDDQLRQNEIVLGGTLLLRYPSVVVRCEPDRVVEQLRRALVTPPSTT